MNGLAIDKLARGNDIIKNDSSLLASIHDNVVNLSFDLKCGPLAFVNINRLVSLGPLDHQVGVVLVKLDRPLFALELEFGRFCGRGCGRLGRALGLGNARGNGGAGLQGWILVRLHVIGDLFQTGSHGLAPKKESLSIYLFRALPVPMSYLFRSENRALRAFLSGSSSILMSSNRSAGGGGGGGGGPPAAGPGAEGTPEN